MWLSRAPASHQNAGVKKAVAPGEAGDETEVDVTPKRKNRAQTPNTSIDGAPAECPINLLSLMSVISANTADDDVGR
jgi:hypothetical protein